MSLFSIERIPEKYRNIGKIEYIGHGSLGTVYRITGSGKDYALKVIDCGRNESKYRIAKKEIEILKHLEDTQFVITVFDISELDEQDSKVVFILEECAISMSEYIKSVDISISGALSIVIGIAKAMLECEKRGVVHLDIQPQNIFFKMDGQVLLGDFSSALLLDELNDNNQMRGTLAFMAPEVYRKKECSVQSDIYSLGVLMYWLLNSGNVPFVSGDRDEVAIYKRLAGTSFPELNSINNEVKAAIKLIINKACAFEKSDRYLNIEEFMNELCMLWNKIDKGLFQDAIIEETKQNDFIDGDKDFGDFVGDIFDADPIATSEQLWDTDPILVPSDKLAGDGENIPGGGYHGGSELTKQNQVPCTNCGRLVGDEKFCPNCGTKIVRENAGLRVSKVNFSAVAPASAVKGEYSLIDVIMYEEPFRKIVDDIIAQSEPAVIETKSSAVKVIENAKIKMIISTPDFEIEDDTEEREWIGEYLNFSFSVMVPESLDRAQILFTISVFINNVMSTRLKFTAKVTNSQEKQEMDIHREDIKSAFVSFAEQDKNRALRIIQGVQLIRPDMDIFMDADIIRINKDYEYAVKREIDDRDVFYLCWSGFAKKSKQVELEWRYALKKKGITGIESLPLELPANCPPPAELRGKHFNDKIFIHMNKKSIEIANDRIQITKNLYLDKAGRVANVNGRTVSL